MGFFQNEEEEDLLGNIAGTSGAIQPQPQMPTMQAQAAPQMNPTVRDYLLKRKAEREQLQSDVNDDAGSPNISAALAAIGAGFQKKDSLAAGMSVLDAQEKSRNKKITDFDATTDRGLAENTVMDEEDPNSEQSKMADRLARKMGYKGGPVSAAQFKKFSPAMEKMLDLEARSLDRQEARDERRSLHGLARQDKLDARADKQKELSAAQAKQRGLYESGKLAEEQYSNASNSSDYDPTSYLEFIDNSSMAPNFMKSDKAVESQAAQSAWIESYLRDASGAAIPPTERGAYAKDFFPQPGDSPDAVKNKAALRAQKQENSRVAAGVEAGHGPKSERKVVKTQTNKKTGEQRVVYSDGTVEMKPGSVAGR